MPDLGQTYTGDRGAIQKKLDDLGASYSTSVKNAPVQQQQTGENMMANEGVIQPLAQDRGKLIQQLMEADQGLAQKYGTQGEAGYIEDPMARDRAMSAATAPTYGALSAVNTLIGSRQKVLGDAMDRGMQMYESGLKAKELEINHLYKQLELLDKQEEKTQSQSNWEKEYALKSGEAGVVKLSTKDQASYDAIDELTDTIKMIDSSSKGLSVGPVEGSIKRLVNKAGGEPGITQLDMANNIAAGALMRLLYPGVQQGSSAGNAIANRMLNTVLPSENDHEDERQRKIMTLLDIAKGNAKSLYSKTGVAHSLIGGTGLAKNMRNTEELPATTTDTTVLNQLPVEGGTTLVEE